MIHPIPSGTRDVLPDEMRELRAITETLRGVFETHGYGEVYTPAIEYENVSAVASGGELPAYRVFDDHGEVLALRVDMTVPIARLVGTRYPTADPPLRFCYIAHAYRAVPRTAGRCASSSRPGSSWSARPGPAGTAEALTVLCGRSTPSGSPTTASGSATRRCTRSSWPRSTCPSEARERAAARARDEGPRRARARGRGARRWPPRRPSCSCACRSCAAGPDVLAAAAPVAEAVDGLRAILDLLEPAVAGRVIFDLGLARGLGYYSGAVFDVYDPALGAPLGGGGRYDDLLGRFGRAAARRRLRAGRRPPARGAGRRGACGL